MIDGLKYRDEILSELEELSGLEEDDELKLVSIKKYSRVPRKRKEGEKGIARDKIAIIYASGSIEMGEGSDQSIGADRISRAIRKARRDKKIKAIVLRINSGGGGVLPSDIIWREVVLAQKEKPVIASFGDVAASGGYWIACPADTIVASPNTITGSIGVFGILPNAEKLLEEKIGITIDRVNTNKFSDMGTFTKKLAPEERAFMQENIENVYDTFLQHVSEGRNMDKANIDSIGQGRVWSGANAYELGLIDVLGGIQEALDIAQEKAGIERYRIVSLPTKEDPFQKIIKELSGDVSKRLIKNKLGDKYQYYLYLQQIANMKGLQARIPYHISIN
jgi:protease-4